VHELNGALSQSPTTDYTKAREVGNGFSRNQLCRCRRECTIFRIDDLPIIELRTRISAAKEGDNTNYQIQGKEKK
jgi:hypothetical protein